MLSHGMPLESDTTPNSLHFKAYVYRHHPHVIYIHEAFLGGVLQREAAPSLSGYTTYVHHARNGLIAYIHSSMSHRLLRCSANFVCHLCDTNWSGEMSTRSGDHKLKYLHFYVR